MLTVRAKHQIAYKGKYYECPQTFQMDDEDFVKYQGDVEIVTAESFAKKAADKMIKRAKTK